MLYLMALLSFYCAEDPAFLLMLRESFTADDSHNTHMLLEKVSPPTRSPRGGFQLLQEVEMHAISNIEAMLKDPSSLLMSTLAATGKEQGWLTRDWFYTRKTFVKAKRFTMLEEKVTIPAANSVNHCV